jgi:RIO-like serine/threonine protein kinase
MELMIENNERLVDMMNNGQLYGYKERTVAEINALNALKRNKLLTKVGAPIGIGMGT